MEPFTSEESLSHNIPWLWKFPYFYICLRLTQAIKFIQNEPHTIEFSDANRRSAFLLQPWLESLTPIRYVCMVAKIVPINFQIICRESC